MGILSQNGHLLVKTQASPGVYDNPGAAGLNAGWLVPLKSGAISPDRELLVPDPEIGGDRDISGAVLGPVAFKGELEMYFRVRPWRTFLASWAMGMAYTQTVQSTTIMNEVFISNPDYPKKDGVVGTPAFLSVEQMIGGAGEFETLKLFNVACNSWTVEFSPTEYPTLNVDLVGQYMQGAGSPTTPTADHIDAHPFGPPVENSTGATNVPGTIVFWEPDFIGGSGATILRAKGATITGTNNIEDDDFRLGSLFLAGLTPKRREVTGTLTVRPEDADLWKQATWGDAAATSAQGGSPVMGRIMVYHYGVTTIPGSMNSEKYGAAWELPVYLHPFSVDPSGDDVLEYDLDFTAISDGVNSIQMATYTTDGTTDLR